MGNEVKYYPLTHPQKAIWYTEKMYPGTSIGNVAASLRLMGKVDYTLLEKAINIFLEKNDATRLRIAEIDGEPRQYVSEYTYHKFDIYDFSEKEITELYKWDEEQSKIPFKLIDSDLFYFALIKANDNDGGFFVRFHHLISDAWTMSLLGNQVIEYYTALKNGEKVSEEMKPSYTDYISSVEEYGKSKRFEKDKEYWNKKFELWQEITTLKTRKENDLNTKARRKTLLVPKKLTARIHEYCIEKGVSEFTLFFAALSMYINRITAKKDITLGTTLLNRANVKEKDTAGMFSTIAVPFRVNIKDDMNFNSFIEVISKESLSMLRHQKYPYDLILKEVREHDKVSGGLFDIFLTYQNSKFNKSEQSEDYITRWHFRGHQLEQLIIHINDREDEGHLIINYDYLVHLFHATEIEFVHQHIINLLWHALDNPEKEISKLEMLSEKEKHKILHEFSEVNPESDKRNLVDRLLNQRAEKIPENMKLYILDKNNNMLPIGISGELCVSASEVNTGSFNDLGLAQARFITHSLNSEEVIYKTGHYARWYPKGDIEYLGKVSSHQSLALSDQNEKIQVKIAATFTGEPIGDYITWWGNKFGYTFRVEFSGYNQVFQELLNANSRLSKNRDGINIALIRFEDFIRNYSGTEESSISKLEQVYEELIQALRKFNNIAYLIVPILLVSTHLNLSSAVQEKIEELNRRLEAELSKYKNIYTINLKDIGESYSIGKVFDGVKDKQGHMPFTDEYYAAIGTEIARKICAIRKQHFKVIVLDCDNTLWKGVCGELGTFGVKIGEPYRKLQEFMLQKYNEGMLLAVCSKNNDKDALEVFDKNPDMILKRKHIVNWKINWHEKSQSIKQIANELNIGLDSFIFLDDSPIECSKMLEVCPEVLTLQLPSEEENIPFFLKHVWAFDRARVTKEDALRSSMYESEQKRQEAGSGLSLDDFIKNLDLRVSMRRISISEVERAAQQTQRTNQFNLSTIRRTKQEITKLMENDKTECFVIEASDKFGEYGIIGLLILKEETDRLFVDTFLLSCRILGRKVENVILSGIRRYAEERGKNMIEALYFPTAKNKPILEFIENTRWNIEEQTEKYTRYKIPVNDLPKEIEQITFYYNERYENNYQVEATNEREIFVLDHVAVAVRGINEAEDYYRSIGYNVVKSVYDPLQNSYLSMCNSEKYLPIELVAPVNEESPSYNKLETYGETPYHLCYKVSNIKSFLEKIKNIEYELISDEKSAILFENKKVAFFMVKGVGLIEVVETGVQINEKIKNNKFKNNTIRLVVNDPEKALAFYKTLGYGHVKNTKDIMNNLMIILLTGCLGEKLELINPLDKSSSEFEFIKLNGSGVYQIYFEVPELEQIKQNLLKSKIETVVDNENKKLMDSGKSYIVFCQKEINKPTSTKEALLYDTKILEKTKHKEYLLPLDYSTGAKLTQLPIFEMTNTETEEYEGARNEIEEKLVDIWRGVLRVERVGINNDFFTLGGDSLDAVIVIGRIHKEFNVELSLKDIFESSTIENLAERIANSNISKYEEIRPVEKQDYYEISSAQKRMYILSQIEKDDTAYNECHQLLIEGNLDKLRLEEVFNKLIQRHEILRTGFELSNGRPIQKIYDNVEIKIVNVRVKEDEIREILKDFVKPFDLSKPPLLRLKLLEINKKRHILLFDIPHIIVDGVSFGILMKEMLAIYEGNELNSLTIQYKDFAHWQNKLLESEEIKKQENYWLNQFKGEIPVLNLPTDHIRPAVQSFNGRKKYFTIGNKTVSKLKEVCNKTDVTLFMLLFAACNVILYRYSGQEDIVIGTPVSGRTHSDLKGVVGMFVNTLPIRTYPKRESKFTEYLREVKENILNGLENQDFQYEYLIGKLEITRDISRNPLFNVMFALQNIEIPEMRTNDLAFTQYRIDNGKSKLDLSVFATEKKDEIEFEVEYCTDLFEENTIERFKGHFINILNEIVENPEKLIADIEILREEEKDRIIYKFNNTDADYPRDKTIHQLFEEQVEKTPEDVAVVFEDKQLTFRELNVKANQLARVLRNKGVTADTIIGIMVERSLEMIVGLLGILKAGGAYLPIDPEYPRERIRYMLEDSGASLLIAQKGLVDKLGFHGEIIEVDDDKLYMGDNGNLENINKPSDLIYIIYTSGSTGKPKGVMVEHRNVNNFIEGVTEKISFNNNVILCITSISFDIFVLETWLPLLKGVKIVLANKTQQLDIPELAKLILKNGVSMIQMTPSRIKIIEEDKRAQEIFKKVKIIMLGGEALTQDLFDKLKSRFKSRIYNMYGPTETTVWSSIKDLTNETRVTIGEPIVNTQLYILDKGLKVQPDNIQGELCIAGNGVTRGYINKPELTSERFVQNPFASEGKLYKTGDLVKRATDGNIEFAGRSDNQVKLRGHRIELGEIERVILSSNKVKECAVLLKKDNKLTEFLCAYIISNENVSQDELKEFLSQKIPNYMIPKQFIQIDQMPLTENGKMNRKELEKVSNSEGGKINFVTSEGEIQKGLEQIYGDILSTGKIANNESFFELGGDSLQALKLIFKIYDFFGVELNYIDIYNFQTIQGLSKLISEKLLNGYRKDIDIGAPFMLLNEQKQKNIFAFPPIAGFGLAFNDIAKEINSFSLYAFNYIENDDKIERYLQIIKDIQKNGPYILLGYSAGADIVIDLSKKIKEEAVIILMDGFFGEISENEIEEKVQFFINYSTDYANLDKNNIFLREVLGKRIRSYIHYLANKNKFSSKIDRDIYFLKSEEMTDLQVDSLSKITTGLINKYKAFGKHLELLTNGYVEKNAKIIEDILTKYL